MIFLCFVLFLRFWGCAFLQVHHIVQHLYNDKSKQIMKTSLVRRLLVQACEITFCALLTFTSIFTKRCHQITFKPTFPTSHELVTLLIRLINCYLDCVPLLLLPLFTSKHKTESSATVIQSSHMKKVTESLIKLEAL